MPMTIDQVLSELRNEAGMGDDALMVKVNSELLRRAADEIERLRFELKAAKAEIEIADEQIARQSGTR